MGGELGLTGGDGDVFGEVTAVLFAPASHNGQLVLATTSTGEHTRGSATGAGPWGLCWLGFSFADQRSAPCCGRWRADGTVDRRAPRHVAVMAWDADAEGNDRVLALRLRSATERGVLYRLSAIIRRWGGCWLPDG